jgi:uncharacterized protein YoaH (UPF0181 family)
MIDKEADDKAVERITALRSEGNTAGGVVEIRVKGLKSGFGSVMTYEEKLDGKLAQALMSIQAIKGVEIGDGFASAKKSGKEVHDEIFYDKEKGFYRETNRAGGIEGGMSNGEEIALPGAPKKAISDVSSYFTVPYSYLDQNGHMNNTRYLDLAEDLIPAALEGKKLKSIHTRYQNEVRHGDVIELQWQELNGIYRVSGGGEKKYFTINFEYYDE